MKILNHKVIHEDQYYDMDYLITILDAFVFTAKTDAKVSNAVWYADKELTRYKEKWSKE